MRDNNKLIISNEPFWFVLSSESAPSVVDHSCPVQMLLLVAPPDSAFRGSQFVPPGPSFWAMHCKTFRRQGILFLSSKKVNFSIVLRGQVPGWPTRSTVSNWGFIDVHTSLMSQWSLMFCSCSFKHSFWAASSVSSKLDTLVFKSVIWLRHIVNSEPFFARASWTSDSFDKCIPDKRYNARHRADSKSDWNFETMSFKNFEFCSYQLHFISDLRVLTGHKNAFMNSWKLMNAMKISQDNDSFARDSWLCMSDCQLVANLSSYFAGCK